GQILHVAARYDHQLSQGSRNGQGHLMVNITMSQANFPNGVQQVGRGRIHQQVKDGDTLESLAKAHNVTAEFLRRLNQMESDEDVRPGDTLAISNRVLTRNNTTLQDISFSTGTEVSEI